MPSSLWQAPPTSRAASPPTTWDAAALSHVKVEWAADLNGTRTEVTNGVAFAVSGDIVLFFTVTLNKSNDNKPEFLGALMDGKKYPRQGMLIEGYRMEPFKLDQSTEDNNRNSAYQVVWGGLESTRGDTMVLFNNTGVSDTPLAIGLGAMSKNANKTLTINAYNMNGVRLYGIQDTASGHISQHVNSGAMSLGHNDRFKNNKYIAAEYGVSLLEVMKNTNNWISLADASGYAELYGADADVAQIIAPGETISEFYIQADSKYRPRIIYDYIDPYNYSYLWFDYVTWNRTLNAVQIRDGVQTATTQLVASKAGTTQVGTDSSGNPVYAAGMDQVSFMTNCMMEMAFVWNEAGYYELTISNWPVVKVSGDSTRGAGNIVSDEYTTIALPLSAHSSGAQLNNVYFGVDYSAIEYIRQAEADMNVNATAKAYGAVAVKTTAHEHHYVAYTGAADSSLEYSPKTCYAYAVYYGVCSVCGKSSQGDTDEKFDYAAGGYAEHTFGNAYSYNSTYHWKLCTVCAEHGHEGKSDLVQHDTAGTDGACSACGFNTALDAIKTQILEMHSFTYGKLSAYETMLEQLDGVKETEHYKAAYDRLTNAVAKLNAGYTFYDDAQNIGTYLTTATQPGDGGDQTYYITVTNPAGSPILLYKENFSETVSGAVGAGQTAVFWNDELSIKTVEYSTDGGATKTTIEKGVAFDVSGDIILYVTITAESEDTYRPFYGFTVGETKYYRHAMQMTNGRHKPYKLDSSADSSGSTWQVIWGGIESTRKQPYDDTFGRTRDYVDAYSFGSTGIKGMKQAVQTLYVYQTKNAASFTSNTGWGEWYTNAISDQATKDRLKQAFNWLTLADKAGYDAYWGGDNAVAQIVPEGGVITDFSVEVYPYTKPTVIYEYIDALNYSYLDFNLNKANQAPRAVKVVNGVEYSVTTIANAGISWNAGSTEALNVGGQSLYLAGLNQLKSVTTADFKVTLHFSWDAATKSYSVSADWPLDSTRGNQNQNTNTLTRPISSGIPMWQSGSRA